MTEKILDRVRKLLNLANDEAATEGERDNALRMAHATLTKYQLSMEDVSQHERDKVDPRGEFSTEGWNLVWCRDVRTAIAKLFMCDYYFQRINSTRGRHTFIGRESNATTCMYMTEWIIKNLLRECDKYGGHRLTPVGRSFGVGAASRLWDRVSEMQRVAQDAVASTGSSLVLLDLAQSEAAANEAFIISKGTEIKVVNTRRGNVNIEAYKAGRKHADSISLNTQVTSKRNTLAIK